jgi:hypothetical protein
VVPDQVFVTVKTFAGLLTRGICDKRTGLSFTVAAGTRQGNHSRVRVLRGPRSHFTVTGSRLPPNLEDQVLVFISPSHWGHFPSPLTARRVTVEVFDPASTRGSTRTKSHIATDGQSVSQSKWGS